MIDGQLDLLDELRALVEGHELEQGSRESEDQRSRGEKDERRAGRGD